ncbi:MAG TPA: PqqD family protein [Acidimicrobiia bacterium]|nr:PqqD family protein [Acidimicrobiia bacterium]
MAAGDPSPLGTVAWRRAETVLWRRTLDGVVVLGPAESAQPVALRGAAADIWELLEEPASVAVLGAALAHDYGVPVERIADDVERAVDALVKVGALCC